MTLAEIKNGLKMLNERYYFGMLDGATDAEEYQMRDAIIGAILILEGIENEG